MVYRHNWLTYKLPKRWCYEEDNENLFLYNPNGEGAVTISFLSVENTGYPLNVQLSIISKTSLTKTILSYPLL